MKKTILILFTLIFTFAVNDAFSQKEQKKKKTETVRISAFMHCQACADNITTNLNFEKGVKKVDADFRTNVVTIEYVPKKINPVMLTEKIRELGYAAELLVE